MEPRGSSNEINQSLTTLDRPPKTKKKKREREREKKKNAETARPAAQETTNLTCDDIVIHKGNDVLWDLNLLIPNRRIHHLVSAKMCRL